MAMQSGDAAPTANHQAKSPYTRPSHRLILAMAAVLDSPKAGTDVPWWRYSLAMRPQARVIRPARLAELVSFLARGKGLGSWDPGGDIGEWLLRVVSSSPGVPGVEDSLDIR